MHPIYHRNHFLIKSKGISQMKSNIAAEVVILQILILDLQIQILNLQLLHKINISILHKTKRRHFLLLLHTVGYVIAGRYLQNLVNNIVEIHYFVHLRQGLEEGVESTRVQHLPHRWLARCPVRQQVLELGKYLQHFPLYQLNILIEKFLDRIGAEIQKHR